MKFGSSRQLTRPRRRSAAFVAAFAVQAVTGVVLDAAAADVLVARVWSLTKPD